MKIATSSAAQQTPAPDPNFYPVVGSSSATFDVSKHIALVPHFREAEVDSYFNAFERFPPLAKRCLVSLGVTFVLGNDLAGGKVMPVLEVLDKPDELCGNDELSNTYPDVFPTCVITRAQSQKAGNVVTLSDSFIALIFTPDMHLTVVNDEKQQKVKSLGSHVTADVLRLPVTREQIIALQKEDQTLAKCFATVNSLGETIVKERNAEYAVDA
ncbi:uncharacterized protein LOC110439519 [Tachysurus ichikawai]